eukprot:c9233_g1_i1.p1 GENE.c9233_g1_i1~~c9233_g1_i1.p1  ORF type:complete len:508 (-),score=84.36 c9233_g1_i1:64-1560(-)
MSNLRPSLDWSSRNDKEEEEAIAFRYSLMQETSTPMATSSTVMPNSDKAIAFGIHPPTLLVMFTSLSFFIYFDRGVYGAVLEDTTSSFHMSHLQGGICSSAYLVCYCLASPIFAQIARYNPPLRLCSLGMMVWVGAVVWSGLSVGFWTLLIARGLTGFGEASFLLMSAPLIDFFAPNKSRSTWLAIFYSAIPLGYAAGAGVAGMMAGSESLSEKWRWRYPYFLEAVIVCPLLLLFARIKGPDSMEAIEIYTKQIEAQDSLTKPVEPHAPARSKGDQVIQDLKDLAKNRLYILIVLGYAMQTFFVGAAAIFGIDYLVKVYDFSKGKAGIAFGIVTGCTGLFGSAIGGFLLDFIKPPPNPDPAVHNVGMLIAAHKLILIGSIVTAPIAIAGFLMQNVWAFLSLLFLGELGVFMMIGPINSSVVWCVPIALQPTAVAMNTLGIHLLGDALSPIVIGGLTDSIGRRSAMLISSFMLILPVFFFGFGLLVCLRMKHHPTAFVH